MKWKKSFPLVSMFRTKLFRYAGVGPRWTVTTPVLREMTTVTSGSGGKAWRKKKNNHNCDRSLFPRFLFFLFPNQSLGHPFLRRIWAVLGVIVPRCCG